MAIYSFSTKATKPEDTALVKRIKERCDKESINFSSLVVQLLREWEKANDRKA